MLIELLIFIANRWIRIKIKIVLIGNRKLKLDYGKIEFFIKIEIKYIRQYRIKSLKINKCNKLKKGILGRLIKLLKLNLIIKRLNTKSLKHVKLIKFN